MRPFARSLLQTKKGGTQMNGWFEDWSSIILDNINRLPQKKKDLYSNSGNLKHYFSVASILEESYKNPSMTKAGFLHGLSETELSNFIDLLYDDNVLKIITGLDQIKALDPMDPNISQKIVMNVLPVLNDYRAAYVFLMDNLDHIDPDLKLREWTQNFKYQAENYSAQEVYIRYLSDNLKDSNASHICKTLASIAGFLNLHVERKCLENVSLCFEQPQLFEKINHYCIRMSRPCELLIQPIKKFLGKKNKSVKFHWEWRHVSGIQRRLPKKDNRPWERFIYDHGFIAIVCKNIKYSYVILHDLHSEFGFHANNVKFHQKKIGFTTEYSAITTRLISPKSLSDISETIPIKIVVDNAAFHVRNMISSEIIDYSDFDEKKIKNPEKISVFTPDGLRKHLSLGSTVLNFCHSVFNKNVVKLKGAIINNIHTDNIFTTLKHGDVIFLKLSDSLKNLPNDWEDKVPVTTVSKIRSSYKQYLKPALIDIGHSWIVQQLNSNSIDVSVEGDALESLVREVDQILLELNISGPGKRGKTWFKDNYLWWYQQIGIFVQKEIQGLNIPNGLFVEKDTISFFLNEIIKLSSLKNSNFINELNIPEEKKSDIKKLDYCNICNPSVDDELIGEIQNEILIFHKSNSFCCEKGFIVTHRFKDLSPQYFFVETKNRSGIAADILNTFSSVQIDIIEIVGLKLSVSEGVFRITTGYIDVVRKEKILSAIENTHGFISVFPPGHDPGAKIEQFFPPKWENSSIRKPIEPYTCGEIIHNDWWFYGMDREKGDLHTEFDKISKNDHKFSRTCFVTGPKRVGKSSLIFSFLRSLKSIYGNYLEIIYEVPLRDKWSDVKQSIFEEFKRSIKNFAYKQNIKIPDIEAIDFDTKKIVSLIKDHLNFPVVIFIDEFIGLAYHSHIYNEADEVANFIDDLTKIPHCLIILAGPSSSIRNHAESIRPLLNKAREISVKSLDKVNAKKLVQVEKLKAYHQIRISDEIFHTLYSLTKGNPFWLNLICKEIWEMKNRSNVLHIEDLHLLNLGKESVFAKKIHFTDRTDYTDDLCMEILKFIYLKGAQKAPSFEEIFKMVKIKFSGITRKETKEALTVLAESGSVRCINTEKDSYWEIYPKIIVEFIDQCGFK